MLDASEYLHLAIHASQSGDHHGALNYLNNAVRLEPDNPAVLYFLAAEHAELGLFERACAGMTQVLELAPELHIARFQLGLLCLQLNRTDEARISFKRLNGASIEPSLQAFSGAYLELLDNHPQGAMALIAQGLEGCTNTALKNDMNRVLISLTTPDATKQSHSTSEMPIFLGAYRDSFEAP